MTTTRTQVFAMRIHGIQNHRLKFRAHRKNM